MEEPARYQLFPDLADDDYFRSNHMVLNETQHDEIVRQCRKRRMIPQICAVPQPAAFRWIWWGYADAEAQQFVESPGWRTYCTVRGLFESHSRTDVARVYFIRAGEDGPIKIGIARNPSARLKTLQTASAFSLRGIGLMGGGRPAEAALHKRFRAHRLSGEWFMPAPELLDFIEREAAPWK